MQCDNCGKEITQGIFLDITPMGYDADTICSEKCLVQFCAETGLLYKMEIGDEENEFTRRYKFSDESHSMWL